MEQSVKHIALIMDGNQRWSKLNNKKIHEGYLEGFKNLEKLLEECKKYKIKHVTVFALSTENMKNRL